MSDPHTQPSWDAQRENAPKRPEFASTVPEEILIARPKRVWVAFIFVLLAVAAFAAVTFIAVMKVDELRDTLVTSLPDDLLADYSEEQTEKAANVLLGSVGGLGALLTLLQLLSSLSLTTGRSGAGRIMFIVTVVIFLPVSALSTIVREDDTFALITSAAAALCLVIAVIVVSTRRVTRWLRQRDGERSTPLTELRRTTE